MHCEHMLLSVTFVGHFLNLSVVFQFLAGVGAPVVTGPHWDADVVALIQP